jgi:hypothetical protein
MKVREEEKAFRAAVLKLRPRLDRAQKIAEVKIPGGLDARQYAH